MPTSAAPPPARRSPEVTDEVLVPGALNCPLGARVEAGAGTANRTKPSARPLTPPRRVLAAREQRALQGAANIAAAVYADRPSRQTSVRRSPWARSDSPSRSIGLRTPEGPRFSTCV